MNRFEQISRWTTLGLAAALICAPAVRASAQSEALGSGLAGASNLVAAAKATARQGGGDPGRGFDIAFQTALQITYPDNRDAALLGIVHRACGLGKLDAAFQAAMRMYYRADRDAALGVVVEAACARGALGIAFQAAAAASYPDNRDALLAKVVSAAISAGNYNAARQAAAGMYYGDNRDRALQQIVSRIAL
jgi:hypothetical protein